MNSDPSHHSYLVLVEDNEADVFLLQRVWHELQWAVNIRHFADGATALAFLRQCGRTPQEPHPIGIVLDLNLPRLRGDALLEQLRQERPDLLAMPVVVFTSSNLPHDRECMTALRVTQYLIKPNTIDEWRTIGRMIRELCCPA